MNLVAHRVDRLCRLLGARDDHPDHNANHQNTELARQTTALLGRPVTPAEIAEARAETGNPSPDILRAIAIQFEVDPLYLLDPDTEQMRTLDHKLAILDTARTLGIKLGAVHFRGGEFSVDALELLITTVRQAKSGQDAVRER
ncbi:hypothetical protein D7D52_30110 [Nocardia yunnanensis]|uniref:Uncharacterized protein n=1 Tax=Nocardia yunnanensis TaxID=2382165 RepID=A0A386ZJ21_9NOCA|nr:hypothetical protein [Nocardia yunnanensis]AYF77370.1 hypothetical protein D7D52_30110 [Nocardia yunnanensis]